MKRWNWSKEIQYNNYTKVKICLLKEKLHAKNDYDLTFDIISIILSTLTENVHKIS